MVGPISQAERDSFTRKVQYGITVFVGLSGGLISLQANASLTISGAAVVFGLLIGGLLAWFVVPSGPAPAERQRRKRERDRMENPFEEEEADDDRRQSRARR